MVLEVENLRFKYNEKIILKDINFHVPKAKTVGILGINGIGKSTLLKILLSLQNFKDGNIKLDGKNLFDLNQKDRAKLISYVPQKETAVFSFLVKDFILIGRNAYVNLFSKPSNDDKLAVLKAANIVGITHLLDRSLYELSGGMMQLVLIARALCTFPKILIMDEPISYLDIFHQNSILSIINLLNTKYGISVLFTSHYPDHTLAIAHKTLLLKGEKGYIFGNTKDVLSAENLSSIFNLDFLSVELLNKNRLLPNWDINSR